MASEPPAEYVCPISLAVMDLPVVACTGQTYNRASIEHWWFGVHQKTCPATGQAVDSVHLVVNVQLYAAIRRWQEQHCCAEATRSDVAKAVNMRTLVPSTSKPAQAFQEAVYLLFQRDDQCRCAALQKLMDMMQVEKTLQSHQQQQKQPSQPTQTPNSRSGQPQLTQQGVSAESVGQMLPQQQRNAAQVQQRQQKEVDSGFNPSWQHCLLTSGAYLELLHLCTHALPCHRWRAAQLLHELARGPHARDVLLRAQYIATLLAALREPDADTALQVQVTTTFHALALNKHLREGLLNTKLTSSMMDLLYSNDNAVRAGALAVLYALLRSRRTAEKLSNSTCMRVLSNLLASEDVNDEVIAAVLAILTALTKIEKNRAKLAAQGGITQLVKVLRREQTNKTLLHAPATALLTAMLADTPTAMRFVKTEGVNCFVDVLTDKGVPEGSRGTVRALLKQMAGTVPPPAWGWSWFTTPPATVSQALVDSNCITAVVRLSAYEAENVFAITLLRILACACHISNKQKFLEEGAVSMLVDALTSTREAAIQEAALALAGLGSDAKLRDAARQAGALQQLNTMASKGSEERRELLQVVMRRLLGHEGDLARYRGPCQPIRAAFQPSQSQTSM